MFDDVFELISKMMTDASLSQQFAFVYGGLLALASRQSLWASAAAPGAALNELQQKWTDDLCRCDVTEADRANAFLLLFTVPLEQVRVIDGAEEQAQNSVPSDEVLRFASIALAAATLSTMRVQALLLPHPGGASMLERAFGEAVFVKTGKNAVYTGLLEAERSFVRGTTDLLNRRLAQYPVHGILPDIADSMEQSVLKLRCACVAGLARQALIDIQGQ